MNVGPRPAGTIREPVQQVPHHVVEGGAFHEKDTKACASEDFRFTTKAEYPYAIELGLPSGWKIYHHSLRSSSLKSQKIQSADLLGSDAKIGWRQGEDGLRVQLPTQPPGNYAYVLRLHLQSEPDSSGNAKR